MDISVGWIPVIVRQTCGVLFTGVKPKGDASGLLAADVDYIPESLNVGGFEYAYEQDRSEITLTQGGLFVFDSAVRISEVRAYCPGSTMIITISDSDNTHPIVLKSVVSAVNTREVFPKLTLPAGQVLKVTTTGLGSIDVYVKKADG